MENIPKNQAVPMSQKVTHMLKGLPSLIKRRWKRVLIVAAVAIPSVLLANFILSEPEPEYLTDTVSRGMLIQAVEAVATVISEKDLELKFPVSGVVEEVLVAEGSTVVAGQELARLKAGSLKAAVTSAQARLTTAYAELRIIEEGTRPEDIAIAEAELRNKQSSLALAQSKYETALASLTQATQKLALLKKESVTALAGEVATSESIVYKELATVQASMASIEDVFEDLALQNIIVQVQPAEYFQMEAQRRAVLDALKAVRITNGITDYRDAITALQEAQAISTRASGVVQLAYNFVSGLEPQGLFDFSKKETLRDSLSTEKTDVDTAQKNIVAAAQSLQDKSANFETRIAAEEASLISAEGARDQALKDINTFETSVQISQAQLDLKRAGSRQGDIDAARGRVQSARADLQKAQSDYDDTVLTAPIDGTITKVNLKKGEFTPGQFSETVAAITILGESPYRTEVYVSEIDIPKIKREQIAELVLDSYPNRIFEMSVAEIDPAATIVDGVPKYRIKLDFTEKVDDLLKIGMTGDLDIITDAREDVLHVPGRAVIKNEQEEDIVRVLNSKGESVDKKVVMGLETITDVEIISGLSEGETIIILQK